MHYFLSLHNRCQNGRGYLILPKTQKCAIKWEPTQIKRQKTVYIWMCTHHKYVTIKLLKYCKYSNNFKLPKNAENLSLPVIVYIHGGGFILGDATHQNWGPEFLIPYEVVVVTLNYRVGVFGIIKLLKITLYLPAVFRIFINSRPCGAR